MVPANTYKIKRRNWNFSNKQPIVTSDVLFSPLVFDLMGKKLFSSIVLLCVIQFQTL